MAEEFVQLPPDGAGKRIHTTKRNDGTQDVYTQIVQIGDRTNPDYIANVDWQGAMNVRFYEGQPQIGAFGALKVTEANTIGIYEHTQDSNDDLFSQVNEGSATNTYDYATSTVVLTTTNAANSVSERTSNRYHYHMPGTGQLILMTVACGDTGKVNNSRHWGYFDEAEGIFFELEGTTMNCVLRTSISGVLVEQRIPRASWNRDIMNGTGNSGFNLDPSKFNIYFIDFQWLGGGRIRMGCYDDKGDRQVMHVFENAGANSYPYMKTGSLPIRFVNRNTGLTAGGSEMRIGTAAVKVEGTMNYTYWRYNYSGVEHTVTTNTTLLGLRSKLLFNGNYNTTNAYPESISLFVTGGPIKLDMWWPPTIANNTFTVDNGSTIEADIDTNTTNAISPGGVDEWLMRTFYVGTGATEIELAEYFETFDEGVLRNHDGTQPTLYFSATKLVPGDTVKTICCVNYKELR